MERLTERFYGDGLCYGKTDCEDNCTYCDRFLKVLNKLADYEDAEEQGRLLPYKIGDKFYQTIDWKNCVDECKVSSMTIKADGSLKIRLSGMFGVFEITTNDIGKTVFATYEQAERELEKRR